MRISRKSGGLSIIHKIINIKPSMRINYIGGVFMSKTFFDSHCDTISLLLQKEGNLRSNRFHIDLERMSKYKKYIQVFALFVDVKKIDCNPLVYTLKILDRLHYEINANSDLIELAFCYDDILSILSKGKCVGVISLEGGEALCGELSTLKILHKLGVRMMNLTWNYKNEVGCGAFEQFDSGISQFGQNVIKEMNALNMIIDISHLGELSFWKAINYSQKPVVASHSNVKKLCNHVRNLSDDQMRAIAQNNGVIGICFNPDFLNNSGNAGITDVIRHIEYICGLVGSKHVGIGSDFDGIDNTAKGLEDISKVQDIKNELVRLNYKDADIDSILSLNMLRLFNA